MPTTKSVLHTTSSPVSIPVPTLPLLPPPEIKEPPKPALPIRDDAQLVDFISSFMFPIAFIIFNIIYWMVYLNMVNIIKHAIKEFIKLNYMSFLGSC